MPHAPEHNCDYRTPGISLVIPPYLRCARVLSVYHIARTSGALEARAVPARRGQSRIYAALR